MQKDQSILLFSIEKVNQLKASQKTLIPTNMRTDEDIEISSTKSMNLDQEYKVQFKCE